MAQSPSRLPDLSGVLFFDVEIDPRTGQGREFGLLRGKAGGVSNSPNKLLDQIPQIDYLCGHGILDGENALYAASFGLEAAPKICIDTLLISSLLFPNEPFHPLRKIHLGTTEVRSNALQNCYLCRDLLGDCIRAFVTSPIPQRLMLVSLLGSHPGFSAFFKLCGVKTWPMPSDPIVLKSLIDHWSTQICMGRPIAKSLAEKPLSWAFLLSVTLGQDTPAEPPLWIRQRNSGVESLIMERRATACGNPNCTYCRNKLHARISLEKYFGFKEFLRSHAQEKIPLQGRAVQAAMKGKSIVATFPHGTGRNLSFQLPAMLQGECTGGLTLVISPSPSTLHFQVDRLTKMHGYSRLAYLDQTLSNLERAAMVEALACGHAHLLFLTPHALRSPSLIKLLCMRTINRVVIDHAECLAPSHEDFRTDTLIIADFIRLVVQESRTELIPPVSCFCTSNRPAVIDDVLHYCKDRLGLEPVVLSGPSLSLADEPRIMQCSGERAKRDELLQILSDGQSRQMIFPDMASAKATVDFLDRSQISASLIEDTCILRIGPDPAVETLFWKIPPTHDAFEEQVAGLPSVILYDSADLDAQMHEFADRSPDMRDLRCIWNVIRADKRPMLAMDLREIARKAGWINPSQGDLHRVRTSLHLLEDSGHLDPRIGLGNSCDDALLVRDMQEFRRMVPDSRLYPDALRVLKRLMAERQGSSQRIHLEVLRDQLGLDDASLTKTIRFLRDHLVIGGGFDYSIRLQLEGPHSTALVIERLAQIAKTLNHTLMELPSHTLIDLRQWNSDIATAYNFLDFMQKRGWIQLDPIQSNLGIWRLNPMDDPRKIVNQVNESIARSRTLVDLLLNRIDEGEKLPVGGMLVRASDSEADSDTLLLLHLNGALRLEKGFLPGVTPLRFSCQLEQSKMSEVDFSSWFRHRRVLREGLDAMRFLAEQSKSPWSESLDEDQLRAVRYPHGNLLVAAGPGTGKTQVLLHKAAHLIMREGVRPDQILVMAYNRPAVREFRLRLDEITQHASRQVQIFTFHSLAFHVLGKIGNLDHSDEMIPKATEYLSNPAVVSSTSSLAAILVDEFQDLTEHEHDLLQVIWHRAAYPRIIVAGDDDQNIFEWLGTKASHLRSFEMDFGAETLYLDRNHRSCPQVVQACNTVARLLPNRLKTKRSLVSNHLESKGRVVIHHAQHPMSHSIVESLIAQHYNGSSAILCQHNIDVRQMQTLFQSKQWTHRVLRSQNKQRFRPRDVQEFIAFQKLLESIADRTQGVLTLDDFGKAFAQLRNSFSDSIAVIQMDRCAQRFFNEVGEYSSLAEWDAFMNQLGLDEFYDLGESIWTLSTMHRAKGTEYDRVILYLPGGILQDAEDLRLLYMSMSRARSEIHLYTDQVMPFELPDAEIIQYTESFAPLPAVELDFGLSNIDMGFYMDNPALQKALMSLSPGSRLIVRDEDAYTLFAGPERMLRFSRKFIADDLESWLKKGYQVTGGVYEHAVQWIDPDTKQLNWVPVGRVRLGLAKE